LGHFFAKIPKALSHLLSLPVPFGSFPGGSKGAALSRLSDL
jgi:hypothetical protein